MKKSIISIIFMTVTLACAGCSLPLNPSDGAALNKSKGTSYYDTCGEEAKKWAESFDANKTSLKIYVETAEGAKEPVEITSADELSDVKYALDNVKLGEKTDENASMNKYFYTFRDDDGNKISFVFREDGAAIIDDNAYKATNTDYLFAVCNLGKDSDSSLADSTDLNDDSTSDKADNSQTSDNKKEFSVSKNVYDDLINDILNRMVGKMNFDYSKGEIGDFDKDGFDELCIVYSVDAANIRVLLARIDTNNGNVISKDFEVCPMAGSVIVHVKFGNVDDVPAFVVWRDDNEDGKYFGEYQIYPLNESTIEMSRKVTYGSDGYIENGQQVDSLWLEKFMKDIDNLLVSFTRMGKPLEELVSESSVPVASSSPSSSSDASDKVGEKLDNNSVDKKYVEFISEIVSNTTDNSMFKIDKGFIQDVNKDGYDEMGLLYSQDGKEIKAVLGWYDKNLNKVIIDRMDVGNVADYPTVAIGAGNVEGVDSFALYYDMCDQDISFGYGKIIPVSGDCIEIYKDFTYEYMDDGYLYCLDGKPMSEEEYHSRLYKKAKKLCLFGEYGDGTPIKDLIKGY